MLVIQLVVEVLGNLQQGWSGMFEPEMECADDGE